MPTVPENEITTPSEELTQQPTSLPPLPLSGNYTVSTLAEHTDTQPTFDPFISLDQNTSNEHNAYERPSSPIGNVTFPLETDLCPKNDTCMSEHSDTAISERKPDPLSNVKPVVYDNPWDLVPDQPIINVLSASASLNNNKGRSKIILLVGEIKRERVLSSIELLQLLQ